MRAIVIRSPNRNPAARRCPGHTKNRGGLSATQAITLFYQQVKWYRGLPFELRVPNQVTQQVFEQTDAGQNLVCCKYVKDM